MYSMLLHRRQGLDFNFSWDSFVCHLTKNVSKGAYCSTSELLLLLSTSIVAADVMAQALFYLILYVVNCVITFELFVTTVVLNVCCCCSYFCLLLLVYQPRSNCNSCVWRRKNQNESRQKYLSVFNQLDQKFFVLFSLFLYHYCVDVFRTYHHIQWCTLKRVVFLKFIVWSNRV